MRAGHSPSVPCLEVRPACNVDDSAPWGHGGEEKLGEEEGPEVVWQQMAVLERGRGGGKAHHTYTPRQRDALEPEKGGGGRGEAFANRRC